MNATEPAQRRDLDEAEREIRRLSRELVRVHDQAFRAETALRRVLDDSVGKRRWCPHPLLTLISDRALLGEIARRGLARWEEIIHDQRAERLADQIVAEVEARSEAGE